MKRRAAAKDFLVISLALAYYIYSLFATIFPALVQKGLSLRIMSSELELTWLFTSFLAGALVARLSMGPVIDRFGPRWVMGILASVSAASMVGMAGVSSLGWAAGFWFISGFSAGPARVILVWVIARTVPRTTYGTWVSSCSGAALFFNACLLFLADDWLVHASEVDVFMRMSWFALLVSLSALLVRWFPQPYRQDKKHANIASPARLGKDDYRGIILTCIIAMMLASSSYAFIGHWAIEELVTYHLADLHTSRIDIAIFYFSLALFSPVVGYLSDSIGPKPVLVTAGALGTLSYLLLFLPVLWLEADQLGAFFALCPIVAILMALALVVSARPVIFMCVARYHPPHMVGSLAGIMASASMLGAMLMDPIISYLQSAAGLSLNGALLTVMPASMILTALAAAALPRGRVSEVKSDSLTSKKTVR